MRRILLGGLGIAFGVLCSPAMAQQPVGNPPPAPARAATLGRPTAVPDPQSSSDSDITQAGLLNRNPSRRVSNAPVTIGTPTPIITQPPGASGGVPSPMPMQFGNGQPMLTLPRQVPNAPPTITET